MSSKEPEQNVVVFSQWGSYVIKGTGAECGCILSMGVLRHQRDRSRMWLYSLSDEGLMSSKGPEQNVVVF
eukprot:7891805-Pyramimonas_sp.AAC.1